MRYFLSFWLLTFGLYLGAQSLRLELPRVDVADGAMVTLPLTVADFDSIVSLQLSINWDTAVASYESFSLSALPLLAIGDFQAEDGELRLSWFDNDGDGQSLEDGTVIANLTFRATGNPGDFTDLRFTGMPLAVQIFRATPTEGVFEPVDLAPTDGRIRIEAPLGFTIESIQSVSCFGASDGMVQLSLDVDTADYVARWEGPAGFSATGFSQNNLAGGTYTVTIFNRIGEIAFSTTIAILEAESPFVLQPTIVTDSDCNSPTGSIMLNATGGRPPYTFRLGNTSNDTGTYTNLAAGTYALSVTDSLGCLLGDTVQVLATDAPALNLPDSLQLCGAESLRIGADSPGNYTWSTGATTDSITISTAGTYSLTISNAAGCSVSDTTIVSVGTPPVAVLENDFLELCPGDSLQLQLSGGLNYEWLGATSTLSADNIPNPIAFPDTSSTYLAVVSNSCGADSLLVELLVYTVTASAGLDTCIAPGDAAQLQAQGGIFYAWQDNLYPVSDAGIPNPTASPEDSTTYSVRITDINGCETLDSIIVLVANNPIEGITAYNLLTPNGDELNDVLDFGPITKYGSNSLKVYNRWGKLVYQRLNYQSDEERFDGTYEGKLLPAGNYFYVLSFRQGEIRQTLTIVRE